MKNIKVLGSGCKNCISTAETIREIANNSNIEINLEKVEEPQQIMAYGVMSTPAVVIDEKVVHSGSVPSKALVEQLLAQ